VARRGAPTGVERRAEPDQHVERLLDALVCLGADLA